MMDMVIERTQQRLRDLAKGLEPEEKEPSETSPVEESKPEESVAEESLSTGESSPDNP